MAGRLLRLLRLPLSEQAALLRLAVLRVAIEPLLAALPLPRLAAMLGMRIGTAAAPTPARLAGAALTDRERRALAAVGHLTARGRNRNRRCLRHALLTGHALRHHDPVLRIGAKTQDGRLAAHAWIECLGGRIDLDAANTYSPLRGAGPA